ncbi:Na+/H+ antiporter family protein [Taylorella equigenitalis]|uniref:Histidine permease YuiF n=3 Tax=Taylorella equigenitalis TaxID=29575 RepID=A0A654KHY1_TAYEM|nr:Na+/H+ antiporter family protein [Taylorella equigenitalis]ADU91486.1 Histidine permease YuiF [Taylorella equigenitalis MCE9]AFN36570.1 putative transporter [Taylorella equigenitalis ATCC 35865]ASY31137.1 sodium:proton antiporter [Taylorella equigenitalis]ASY38437.1 sodium:proton antiporter [Taylorella equigenitalis]ASY39972.1 sodium:proton antiporter [Taylorella equigenitalis]
MNAVVLAVIVMLVLAVSRVHVVLSLLIAALVGGLASGLSLSETIKAFESGLGNGATVALSYALLGAFAMAIAHSGLPEMLANKVIVRIKNNPRNTNLKWMVIAIVVVMGMLSQNIIPIHIAFIPIVIPPLLVIFNQFKIDRRMIACAISFGLVTCYMTLPYGFGEIFLNQILLPNVQQAGLDTTGISIIKVMGIPALGMIFGLLFAIFVSYRKPRTYLDADSTNMVANMKAPEISSFRSLIAIGAIVVAFVIQLITDSLIMGALSGFALFIITGVIKWKASEGLFSEGLRLMCMIGFIMITAQGFAEVMKATNEIEPLVKASTEIFGGSKLMAALSMLSVGLLVTMGIGSSFSTLPIIAAIFVPICAALGFSPAATVALIGTAGALGDTGSPASDSTLGPTSGLNIDGQHDHIRDTVIPTFLHYNIPLLIAGTIAALVL